MLGNEVQAVCEKLTTELNEPMNTVHPNTGFKLASVNLNTRQVRKPQSTKCNRICKLQNLSFDNLLPLVHGAVAFQAQSIVDCHNLT